MRPTALLLALAAACGREAREPSPRADSAADTTAHATVDTTAAAPERRTWEHLGVPFHPDSLSVGDTVAGLRVARLRIERAYDGTAVGSVWFTGTLRLRGRTMRNPEADYQGPCFEADSASAERMPRWRGDLRRPWFCFADPADAAARLGPSTALRDAEITVDRFAVHVNMSDAVNEARLVTVH